MANEVTEDQELDIDLPVGTKLNIKIDGIAIPITSQFVGLEKNEYLLITLPAPFTTIKSKLYPGNKLVVQYLYEGAIFVFAAKIIDVLTKPIRVAVLEYPDKVVNRGLRAEKRTMCRIPASISFKGSSKDGIIGDINVKGCRLVINYQLTEKNYIARSGEPFKISCRFPTSSREITLTGIIRNVTKKNLSLSYGIQFDELTQDVRMIIEQYVETIQE
ncbi:MAG: flagellar brake protein [Pseudomonadota bacterium]